MAEAAGFDLRRILLIAGVVLVVVLSLLVFLFRGCAPMVAQKPGYTVIYTNMELRDAANVIARLKELAIPYEIRDDGRAIAVPKDRADQARLGLAEKNLPAGGVVGWEIFDQTRMGATDFDRRIQLIRAISGELSRTIRRIEGVDDVRVQIVIPETKLFATTVVPVTASVMLRLQPGVDLSAEKINGIVHLVASSVENLQTENVTVIDDSGKILSAKAAAPESKLAPVPPPAETVVKLVTPESASAEVIIRKEAAATGETVAAVITLFSPEVTAVASLTAEERILLKAQAKKELEKDLSGKAQELLNRFYPPNSVIVKVGLDVMPTKDREIKAKDLKIRKIYAVILVDNRIDFDFKLKQATMTTVAAAIGYDRKRGDRIILERVPFHLATPAITVVKGEVTKELPKISLRSILWWGGMAAAVLIAFWLAGMVFRSRGPAPAMVEEPVRSASPARENVAALDQIRNMAERNPERIADLLKEWLSE
jgi:flagellar M-ring protein FliF